MKMEESLLLFVYKKKAIQGASSVRVYLYDPNPFFLFLLIDVGLVVFMFKRAEREAGEGQWPSLARGWLWS